MKHAILIIGHGDDISQCVRCVRTYGENPNFRTFIHWDTKFPLTEAQRTEFLGIPSVRSVIQKIDCHWSGYSEALSEIVTLKDAWKYSEEVESLDYFHIISADSLMMVSPNCFLNYFEKIRGKSIVPYTFEGESWSEDKRFRDIITHNDRYVFGGKTYTDGDSMNKLHWDRFSLDHSVLDMIYIVSGPENDYEDYINHLKVQIKTGLFPQKVSFKWYWRSAWMSLFSDATQAIIKGFSGIVEPLSKTKFAVESFAPTILMNNPDLSNKLINNQIMYTNFNAPTTHRGTGAASSFLIPEDVEKIVKRKNIFARKFGHDITRDKIFLDHFVGYQKQLENNLLGT